MSIEKDLELLYEIGCLRHVDRTWKQFHGLSVANISEHTFRTLWTALIIAKKEGVTDIEKIMKMVLVHDVSESRTGDAHYLAKNYVKRSEDKAIADSLKDTSLEELKNLWEEFDKCESIEAKIAKDADILDIDIEIQELKNRGHKLDHFIKFREQEFLSRLHTNTAKEIWKHLQESNPDDWHVKGPNQHNLAKEKEENS